MRLFQAVVGAKQGDVQHPVDSELGEAMLLVLDLDVAVEELDVEGTTSLLMFYLHWKPSLRAQLKLRFRWMNFGPSPLLISFSLV
ncbi:hypothetical protein TB1_012981 [Malus domestica]